MGSHNSSVEVDISTNLYVTKMLTFSQTLTKMYLLKIEI